MKAISYINVYAYIYEEYQDIALALLSDLPFQGIEQRADELVVCFKKEDYDSDIKDKLEGYLKQAQSSAEIRRVENLEEKNWNEEYEQRVKSVIVSDRIGIAPTWRLDELDSEIKIEINPKMSFGTGEHATTRLVARLQEKYTNEGENWIDAGTGTGILAIVAEKLGAASVYAFDNNEWSINNSLENIRLNGCENIKVEMADIDTIELPECDGIVANIFTNLIVSSMPKFAKSLKSGCKLICSGIMIYDKDKVIDSAKENGLIFIEDEREDEWIALAFEKN